MATLGLHSPWGSAGGVLEITLVGKSLVTSRAPRAAKT